VTDVQTREARPVPRPLLRLSWAPHRAIYRASVGVAIVGYYDDGPKLMTLAMNGRADAEPA
jgi:hypothetical protein